MTMAISMKKMIAGCGTMLPTRSIVVRKPSRTPPFARSSMLDAGSFAIVPSPDWTNG